MLADSSLYNILPPQEKEESMPSWLRETSNNHNKAAGCQSLAKEAEWAALPTPGMNEVNVEHDHLTYNSYIAALRPSEFPQLGSDTLYLDHAGTTIPSRSLIMAFSEASLSNVLGNPHSGSAGTASQTAHRCIEDARFRALRWFKADPDKFDLIFVANATAGIKLVADGLRGLAGTKRSRDQDKTSNFQIQFGFHGEAHTSLVGLREEVLALNGSRVDCLEKDEEVERWLMTRKAKSKANSSEHDSALSFLAYPAQSNMDGRQLPLSWLLAARSSGVYTLLDAAALVPTSPLDLSNEALSPDLTVLSFYKMFGMPDLGALIVRKSAAHLLSNKAYFGGGTVEMVSTLSEQWHIRKQGQLHEILEDGTLPVHNILMLNCAFDTHLKLFGGMSHVRAHTKWLSDMVRRNLSALRHWNEMPVCHVYGAQQAMKFGPIVALNFRNADGTWMSTYEIEKLASAKSIQFRTGSVCNPGGIALALELSAWEMQANFTAGLRCGGDNDIANGKPTGIVRVSFGALSTIEDAKRFVEFVKDFLVEKERPIEHHPAVSPTIMAPSYEIESLTIYPIKSCAGWTVPESLVWSIRPEGLAWDREWCIVHQGTQVALNQKKFPQMALLKPKLDLEHGVLLVSFQGKIGFRPRTPSEVSIPLSSDPSLFVQRDARNRFSTICDDAVQMQVYSMPEVNEFFSTALSTPCQLARFPPSSVSGSARHAKLHLKRNHNLGSKLPLLLSNESPILVVSRSSINRLNETIKKKSPPGRAASAAVFRPNIVIRESPSYSCVLEQPWVEDYWESILIKHRSDKECEKSSNKTNRPIQALSLDILGPCRRCQMICIDQDSGERNRTGEPLVSLAKTRRRDGKIWFGMHAALTDTSREGRVMVGDKVEAIVNE